MILLLFSTLAFIDINFKVTNSNIPTDHEDDVDALNLETLDDIDQFYDDLTMGLILKSDELFTL